MSQHKKNYYFRFAKQIFVWYFTDICFCQYDVYRTLTVVIANRGLVLAQGMDPFFSTVIVVY